MTLFAKFLGQSTYGDEGGIDNTEIEEGRTYEWRGSGQAGWKEW